jgi:hypothetical protein
MDDALALVQRGWDHLHRQQPLAAWAAWQRALLVEPGDRAATAALARLESSAALPTAATAVHRFRPPGGGEERRRRWDEALRGRDLSDLADAASAFGDLAAADPHDAAAVYNAALCHAWAGANAPAVAALAQFVAITAAADFEAAVAAWTLAEVLRHGAGAETLADDLTFLLTTPRAGEPADLVPPAQVRPVELPELDAGGEGNALAFEWLDRPMPEPGPELHAAALPHVLASVVASGAAVRYSTPLRDHIDEVEERLVAAGVGEPDALRRATSVLPLSLLDAAVFTFRLPRGLDDAVAADLTREAIEGYFENAWIHEPRRGLDPASGGYLTPLAAARKAARGDLAMRARLAGIVRLREQLADRPSVAPMYAGYPFDRLRRRLGLEPRDPATLDPNDFACMSPAELEAVAVEGLDQARLLEATRSARGLFDFPQAARFAEAVVGRDPSALVRVEPPWLARVLVEGALAGPEPDATAARDWIERAIALADAPGSGTTEAELEALWDELTGA